MWIVYVTMYECVFYFSISDCNVLRLGMVSSKNIQVITTSPPPALIFWKKEQPIGEDSLLDDPVNWKMEWNTPKFRGR